MNVHVQQEGYGGTSTQRLSFQSREDQKRQPGEQRDDQNPSSQEFQRISCEMGPTEKLKERPTQDEREIAGLEVL